ncbi:MAG: hypothetical protein ABIS36_19195 [Chryseolinea sp.]
MKFSELQALFKLFDTTEQFRMLTLNGMCAAHEIPSESVQGAIGEYTRSDFNNSK